MLLIGLTGYKGSGKTTAAEYLVRTYGFRRMRFAQPLKTMLYALGLNEREVDGDLKEVPCARLNGVTPRLAQQTLGTEWGRMMIHPDLWVSLFKQDLAKQLVGRDKDLPVVIDDARFANEFGVIRAAGGKVWRIARQGAVQAQREHQSEYEQDSLEIDHTVLNQGTVVDLWRALDRAFSDSMGLRGVRS